MATKNMKAVNEQEWDTMAAHAIIEKILEPLGHDTNGNTGDPLHDKLKVSRGYPPVNALKNRGRVVGVCIDPTVSLGGFTEIFVSPYVSEPMEMLSVLVHELGHAVQGNKVGHGPAFTEYCKEVGLAPPANPMTGRHDEFKGWQLGTVVAPGSPLEQTLQEILDELPPFPGAGLNLTEVEKQRAASKAKTLMLKMYCDNPQCPGFLSSGKVNVSRTTWSNVRIFGCDTCTSCGKIKVIVLPKVNGIPQKGEGGGPIDPDVPPVVVDGYGEGESEPLPDNVRVTGEDKTPNAKPMPGKGPDGKDTEPRLNAPDDDDDDFEPSPEEIADDSEGDTPQPGPRAETPADGGEDAKPTRTRNKRMIPKAAHAADFDCTQGEGGKPCEDCHEAMRLAGLEV